jgi:glycine oxidase
VPTWVVGCRYGTRGASIESMSPQLPAVDVVVVGGGAIGLAVAWRTRLRGLSVTVLERGAVGEECASAVAAGMLAPVSEVEFGEAGRRVLELGLRSARMWPVFAAELQEAAGIEVGLRRSGTLVVARDLDGAAELERQIALRRSLGLTATRLLPSAARGLEPALAPTVRLALEAPEDHSVEPRRVLAALRRACQEAGVQLREHATVVRVDVEGGSVAADGGRVDVGGRSGKADGGRVDLEGGGERVTGVSLADGGHVSAGQVVLAAGAWSAELEGLPPQARVPVRPVKGQILRLRDPNGPGLLERVLRFQGGYLVPRGDGRYVLGATVEERGFEDSPTAGGVYELLREARELLPGVLELQIEELSVGFRPATPDNVPAIGPGALEGLVWATGHHRNGILLAPLTAELLAGVLAGELPSSKTGGGNRGGGGEDGGGGDRGDEDEGGGDRGGEDGGGGDPDDGDPGGVKGAGRDRDYEDEAGGDSDRALLAACDPRRFQVGAGSVPADPPGPPLGVHS